jgi:ribosomal protein L16/L10AE
VCNVKKGNVVLEIDNLRENEARLVLKIAKQKLPGNFLIIRR